jgi:hypothetical protein
MAKLAPPPPNPPPTCSSCSWARLDRVRAAYWLLLPGPPWRMMATSAGSAPLRPTAAAWRCWCELSMVTSSSAYSRSVGCRKLSIGT